MSSFEAFVQTKRRQEAQADADIVAQMEQFLPSVVTAPGRKDADLEYDSKFNRTILAILLIGYDIFGCVLLYVMEKQSGNLGQSEAVTRLLLPAIQEVQLYIGYSLYISVAISTVDALMYAMECWKSRSVSFLHMLDTFFLLVYTALLFVHPTDAIYRLVVIARIIRFFAVVHDVRSRLKQRLGDDRIIIIREKEKVAVLRTQVEQMEAKLSSEQLARERTDKRLAEYRKEVDTLKEALMYAASEYATLEEVVGQQLAVQGQAAESRQRAVAAAATEQVKRSVRFSAAPIVSSLSSDSDDNEGYDTANSAEATQEPAVGAAQSPADESGAPTVRIVTSPITPLNIRKVRRRNGKSTEEA